MLSGLLYWLSPSRRRFISRVARPGLDRIGARLKDVGSPGAVGFVSTLLNANADFLAYALACGGPLTAFADLATPEKVASCMRSMLLYSVNLFARAEMAGNDSELIGLLAHIMEIAPDRVMLMRDSLRKAPRSEEWLLLTWIAKDLGAEAPKYNADLERAFGYNYLSYIDQFRPALAREAPSSESN
ncbi:MAG TPA: hypothetical protein VMT58_07115 [Candidatus Binataceae bacterium]|nr:hypothetical protein [Candidatus Binataceae bacterium]